MKRLAIALGIALSIVSYATSSMAASGKAYIPHYRVGNDWFGFIYLSNITDTAVTVEITLFEKDNASGAANPFLDGDDSTSSGPIWADNVSNYDESPASGSTVKFDIAPFETANIQFVSGSHHGYGFVEWTQASDNMVALTAIAYSYHSQTSRLGAYYTPIHAGEPF